MDCRSGERGVALIAVLWTVVLLSILATALIATSRSESRSIRSDIARLQAGEAANAGIGMAIAALSEPDGGDWPINGAPRSLRFENADLTVSVSAENGKIDLNAANPALLRSLLVVAGLGPGASDSLAGAIISKRKSGGVPFNNVGELMRVPGVTRELYDRLAPNLTVYSGARTVDLNVAPSDVLLAIPGNTTADAEALIKGQASIQSGIASPDGPEKSRIGQAFKITAVAHSQDAVVRRTKVVRLTGSPFEPYWVLATE